MKTTSFDKKTLLLDPAVYSAEAVKLAAFVFSGRAEIKVSSVKGGIKALVKAEDAVRTAGEFLNEALNQQCRLDLAKKNSRIAAIIVTKALLSSIGGKESSSKIKG